MSTPFRIVFTYSSGLWVAGSERLTVCECVCCRPMVSQAAMRSQRVVESVCRCWNPAVWVLVSLLGSLVLVAVSVLLRLGKCVGGSWGLWYHVGFPQNLAKATPFNLFVKRSLSCALQNTSCDKETCLFDELFSRFDKFGKY